MFKWLNKLITRVSCTTCEFQSEGPMQGPKGFPKFYCLCPKKQETKYSYAEGRNVSISYPCDIENPNGYCGKYKEKGA